MKIIEENLKTTKKEVTRAVLFEVNKEDNSFATYHRCEKDSSIFNFNFYSLEELDFIHNEYLNKGIDITTVHVRP